MAASSSAEFPLSERTVAELLAGIGSRDPASWAEIVRRYHRLLCSRARRYQLPEADVLDAVQATWLRLAERWETVEFPERLPGWLATTVQRECLRIVNARKGETRIDDIAEQVMDRRAGPEQQVVDADTAAAIRRLVHCLRPAHRELLDALFFADAPRYTQLSSRIGIPVGSIGPTRARGLRMLRVLIEEHGLAPSA
jgi:RNA polymerase sigma factor (sigma-70 family)